MEMDFVVTWVDGSDIEWLNEKKKYTDSKVIEKINSECRYRDPGTLKYWFRSVEKYAPWVRKIHFITWGHLPDFLDVNHPKINIVKHEDYIPKEYLPTFSARAINMNLHRINGLSEQFVYFDDDMFLNAPVEEKDFFVKGKPCNELVDGLYTSNIMHNHIIFNDMFLINKHFSKYNLLKSRKTINKLFNLKYRRQNLFNLRMLLWPCFGRFKTNHVAEPLLKSTIKEVWEKEFDVLNETCLNKFRKSTDVNQYLFSFWDLARGNFEPARISAEYYEIVYLERDKVREDILKETKKLICINDSDDCNNGYEKNRKTLLDLFEQKYPEKSSFEKTI
jgi:hypothetical protein